MTTLDWCRIYLPERKSVLYKAAPKKELILKKLHNFSAGPSILPQEVFSAAAAGIQDLNGTGLSILEISHRSEDFIKIYQEAVELIRDLLNVPTDFDVLFLSGGASTQFFMVPMNLLAENATAAYLDTGTWSTKAIKEVGQFGLIDIVASSKDQGFKNIPKDYKVPKDATYLHITTNNTIYGTQMHNFPETSVPLVADMSSDIMSRPLDLSPFGLIYAGAQKNLGPAGTTVVLVRKDLLGKTGRKIPTMLDYRTHIEKDSSFNTPPVFPIYATMLNLRWLKNNGGLEAAYARNQAKATLLYKEIDRNTLFDGVVEKADRSLMNITFTLHDASLEDEFVGRCTSAGCVGIKGHRSVGGFRASTYNAMPMESVEVLAEQMRIFESDVLSR